MNTEKTQTVATLAQKNYVEETINRWYFLLEYSRGELHAGHWQQAVVSYHRAHQEAELLVSISDCKNCAVKGYVRTLIEYSYALCKVDDVKRLADLIGHAEHTLSIYVTRELVSTLLQPLRNIGFATHAERDLWMNQLFAEEAQHRKQVH